MNKLRVIEAFAGVGSQRMALDRLGVEHEVVGIFENDKYAIASYTAIHGEVNNLGDISKVSPEEVPDHDLFTYSFPCQDLSIGGKHAGMVRGQTRSGLLYECERIIEAKRPKLLLLENVKNLLSKRHKADFDKWLEYLEGLGYTNYYKVLNAKDYGQVPQNRERVFVVSILGEHEPFTFPEPVELNLRLKDILEEEVDSSYYLTDEQARNFLFNPKTEDVRAALTGESDKIINVGNIYPNSGNPQAGRIYGQGGLSPTLDCCQGGNRMPKIALIKNNTKKGYLEAYDGDGIYLAFPSSETRRGRVQPQRSHTLDTSPVQGVIELPEFRIRRLTPRECWRLMSFMDQDFDKAQKVVSNSQLYKQAGNSIVVNVLVELFKRMLWSVK